MPATEIGNEQIAHDLTDHEDIEGGPEQTPEDGQTFVYRTSTGTFHFETPPSVDASAELFHAFDAAGGIALSSGWADITYDTEVKDDTAYSHDADSAEVTISKTGWYSITYYVGIESSTDSRSEVQAELQEDTGSGYTTVPGTLSFIYSRLAAQGKGSASVTIAREFTIGDKIKVRAQRSAGGATITTAASACGIHIIASLPAEGVGHDRGHSLTNVLDHTDVDVTDPEEGQVLVYSDEDTWVNQAPASELNYLLKRSDGLIVTSRVLGEIVGRRI